MIEIQYIRNEQTGERRLYYRSLKFVFNVPSQTSIVQNKWTEWKRVPELTIDESSMQDLIESGGLPEAQAREE